jgi:hypothetical protein
MKNSNDTTGNRTRDLLAYSAVPQPTAPPRAPTVRTEDYIFYYGKGNENHQWGRGFCVHHGKVSPVKTVEFVSDRMSHIVLGGRRIIKNKIECACTK